MNVSGRQMLLYGIIFLIVIFFVIPIVLALLKTIAGLIVIVAICAAIYVVLTHRK